MGKPNSIRKRALDFARKRQWDKALAEFNKLVEVESNNPNLFNEIGDLHIKLDNKREAFKSFHKAVDAYTKVGLHNNAVAVCKKIIRLNPGDHVVYGKLARLRHRQGFHREAERYSLDFFEKAVQGPDVATDDLKDLAVNIALAAEKSPAVLERAAEYLMNCDLRQDAGTVLEKLYHHFSAEGNTAEVEKIKTKMSSIGFVPAAPPPAESPDKLETIESHRSKPDSFGDTSLDHKLGTSVPPHIRRGNEDDVAGNFGVIEIGRPADSEDEATQSSASGEPEGSTPEDDGSFTPDTTGGVFDERASNENEDEENGGSEPAGDGLATTPECVDDTSEGVKEYVIPEDACSDTLASPENAEEEFSDELSEDAEAGGGDDPFGSNGPSSGADSADGLLRGLASEVTADVDEDDHRSHYDLGMAYLEMALLDEAIREFQFAANSAQYRVRSLEMIGRCFLEKNKPQLAIKQLTRGLSLVGADDGDSLGIKYNLGLAYEMIGDDEKAQAYFEDVYVVDVTFRDIENKFKKYAT